MDGISWIRSLGGPPAAAREPDWLDVLIYAEEQHPGKGDAARWLAGELGVSVRSAERYRALGQLPARHRVTDELDRIRDQIREEWAEADAEQARQQVADLLRLITTVSPGRVEVLNLSGKNRGRVESRSIVGDLPVNLGDVASAWEDEDEEGAALALSEAIIEAYGDRGAVDELHAYLDISSYVDGLDYA